MHVFRVSETYRDNCNQGISIDRSTVHYGKLYSTCLLCRYHRQGSGRFWQLRERWRQKCDGGCCWPWYQRETGEGRGGLIGEEDLRLTDKSQRARSRWSSVKGKLLTIPRADECRKKVLRTRYLHPFITVVSLSMSPIFPQVLTEQWMEYDVWQRVK